MSNLSFPTVNGNSIIQKMSLKIVNSMAVNTSPYTYQQQVQNMGGSRWEAVITIRPLNRTEALAFQAFLAGLRGQLNTFTVGNPLSTMSSPPTVAVAGSGATAAGSLAIPLELTGGSNLVAGQEIQIGDHLYMILEDATTSGGGTTTTVGVAPPIRESISVGTSVTVNNPKGIWRLDKPEVNWNIDRNSIYSFTLSCTEAV